MVVHSGADPFDAVRPFFFLGDATVHHGKRRINVLADRFVEINHVLKHEFNVRLKVCLKRDNRKASVTLVKPQKSRNSLHKC